MKPLIEVSCEIRQDPIDGRSTNLMMKVLKIFEDSHISIENRQGLNIPTDVKQHQPELYYIPSYEITYDNFKILISDGSLVVLERNIEGEKYRGWDDFKETVRKTYCLSEKITRLSLKYSNLIKNEIKDLSFNLNVLNKLDINSNISEAIELRFQEIVDSSRCVIEVSNPTRVETLDKNKNKIVAKGLLFTIDVICKPTENILENSSLCEYLEQLHNIGIKKYQNIYVED